MIGYERSYHGRPAGFRTHALVCVASSLLMLVTVYEAHWMRQATGLVQIDPTRMAQGIMTGIGFLGAGVILHEGPSVRGLTTAASIWGLLTTPRFSYTGAVAATARKPRNITAARADRQSFEFTPRTVSDLLCVTR